MSHEKAIVLHRPGRIGWDRQVRACMAYAGQHGYELAGVVRSKDDAVRLVRDGLAALVIAAAEGDDDEQFAEAVRSAGGRLEYCRGRRRRPSEEASGRDSSEIAQRMHELGESTEEIARMLRLPVQRIRDLLRPRGPVDRRRPGRS